MNPKEWLLKVALKKVFTRVATLIVAYVATLGIEKAGLQLDQAQAQQFLVGAMFAGLEMFRNWLKVKYGLNWL